MSRKRFIARGSSVAIAVLMALSSCLLLAQSGNQGTIVVTAQDDSGAVIPGANLELVDVTSNSIRKALTEGQGNLYVRQFEYWHVSFDGLAYGLPDQDL